MEGCLPGEAATGPSPLGELGDLADSGIDVMLHGVVVCESPSRYVCDRQLVLVGWDLMQNASCEPGSRQISETTAVAKVGRMLLARPLLKLREAVAAVFFVARD